MVTPLGYTTHVFLCQAISGSGTSVTTDGTQTVYLKSKEPEFGISFDSKIKQNAFGKTRMTPDLKYKQSVQISDSVLLSHQLNDFTEWVMDRYIAKAMIYLIIKLPDASPATTYTPHIFYTKTQSKVYYLKGTLDKLKAKIANGRIVRCSFTFLECSD
jgi:hypothetical protein